MDGPYFGLVGRDTVGVSGEKYGLGADFFALIAVDFLRRRKTGFLAAAVLSTTWSTTMASVGIRAAEANDEQGPPSSSDGVAS
jgi:hypothetical protein